MNNGKPETQKTGYGSETDVFLTSECLRYYAGFADKVCLPKHAVPSLSHIGLTLCNIKPVYFHSAQNEYLEMTLDLSLQIEGKTLPLCHHVRDLHHHPLLAPGR